jgi:hypothetical protein
VLEFYFGFDQKFSVGVGFVLGLVSMKIIDFVTEGTDSVLQDSPILKKFVKPKKDVGDT